MGLGFLLGLLLVFCVVVLVGCDCGSLLLILNDLFG